MIGSRVGAVIGFGLVLLTLFGCSAVRIVIDDSDAGSIQSLNVGDVLYIRLYGNATTGYEWARVEPPALAGSPLEMVKEGDYRTSGTHFIGESGEFVFRYRAVRSGTIILGFEYRRPWEPQDPIEAYSVTVWVR